MVADADVRDMLVPRWARACLLVATIAQLVLGVLMLVRPQMPLFVSISPERLAWQAIGILEVAVGAALIATFLRPVRNSGLIVAGIVLNIAGLGMLLYFAATESTEWQAALPLMATEAAGGCLLALALLAIARTPELVTAVGDLRPISTTTLFGLQQTLQALAAPATVQLAMFPDLIANGERVMQDFKTWRERALQKQEMLSPQQKEALVGLDECLQRMLHPDAVDLWNGDSVRTAPEWSQLRATARRTLVAFAWSVDMPMGVLKRRRETPSSVDMRPPT